MKLAEIRDRAFAMRSGAAVAGPRPAELYDQDHSAVDCTPWICELVRYHLEDVTVKGAWTGPAALQLF
jgi:hypothetical protein